MLTKNIEQKEPNHASVQLHPYADGVAGRGNLRKVSTTNH